MKKYIRTIDTLFDEILGILTKHNEVFFIENPDESEFGYLTPDGEEVNESDYQVYSDVDKYGHYNTYAITKLENGIAHLVGIGDTEDEKEIEISLFSMSELYDLANMCNIEEKPNE